MTLPAQWARAFWHYLKEVSGENDYWRYRAKVLAEGGSVVSAKEFYIRRLRQKYATINRCC